MENNDLFSEINSDETEVTLLQGFLTRLIDFAIDILILLLIYKFIPRDIFVSLIRASSFSIVIIAIIVSVVNRFFFLLLFNKTIGMMICNVKYLNGKLQPLSIKEKIVSLFRTRFSSIKYYKDK